MIYPEYDRFRHETTGTPDGSGLVVAIHMLRKQPQVLVPLITDPTDIVGDRRHDVRSGQQLPHCGLSTILAFENVVQFDQRRSDLIPGCKLFVVGNDQR